MAPLILHNVPDEERFIGDDGIRRPYAMYFDKRDNGEADPGTRSRRANVGKGSFGKSTRRSRSKTATPARREDPTAAAADLVFESWKAQQFEDNPVVATTPQRKPSSGPSSQSQEETVITTPARVIIKEPTELILRGYRNSQQQYAAINHFEQLAGRICEDYPRDPPLENRRYKSELRDPAYTRRQALSSEEKLKVNRADGGEHWVKVTFESAEAADSAIHASPQPILGHLVYADPYHGIPPTRDDAVPDPVTTAGQLLTSGRRSGETHQFRSLHGLPPRGPPIPDGRGATTLPKSFTTTNLLDGLETSPPRSQTSSRTLDTATINTESTTATSETITGTGTVTIPPPPVEDSIYCRRVPGVRKVKLLSAEQALLPQPSYTQRVVNKVPFLKWFSGSMIGNEVPRTDTGEFDWDRASLYWKVIWWLDSTFRLFGGEILNADKDD